MMARPWSPRILALAVASGLFVPFSAGSQTVQPPYDTNYSIADLGPVPGLPSPYGGLTFAAGDPNTIVIGGAANGGAGQLFSIAVVRDTNSHITGFSGTAAFFADAAYNDGGVAYGPGGVLFLARWPVDQLGQTKPGSTITDKIIDLSPLGVTVSPGGLNFVPAGFPGAGQLKVAGYGGGNWYVLDIAPDGSGTYDVTAATQKTIIGDGPEGFVYVPPGSPLFQDFKGDSAHGRVRASVRARLDALLGQPVAQRRAGARLP